MRRALTALALAGALLVSACGSDEPEGQLTGSVVDPPFDIAAQPLTDTEGEEFSLVADTDKRLTLVFFGYTQCPDVCPLVMQTVASGLSRLTDAEREQVDVVFVSTDPETDKPRVLRDYLDRFDPSFIGVRGDLDTTVEIAETMGVFVADAEELATGGYDLGSHGSYVIAVDGNDQAPLFWRQDTSSAEYAADISQLLGQA